MFAATLAAADVGQYVTASFLGLGAAGVAGGVVAMTWSVHTQQIRLAERLARREVMVPADDAAAAPAHAPNGNGNGAGNGESPAGRSVRPGFVIVSGRRLPSPTGSPLARR